MSLPVFSWVLDHSDERLGNRLTLLALAEHAHDDGTKAFPSVTTLMRRTRLSERQVRNCLRALEVAGAIESTGATRTGTRVYTVIGPFNTPKPVELTDADGGQDLPGEDFAPGAKSGSDIAPEPSVGPVSRSSSSSTAGKSPQTVDGKKVTLDEHDMCDAILVAFNAASGKQFAGKDWRRAIIMRIRDHPEVTLDRHVEIIRAEFASPWWEGDPTPSVIYGNSRVFDSALNGVRRGKKNGNNGTDAFSAYD